MSFANLYNGKLLTKDGKLAIGNDCCCDCPECPPLDTLPQLCYLKVTVPSSLMITGQSVELFLIYTGDYVSRPQWTKEVVNGVCYYNYAIDLSMPCCVHRCDDSCEIPLSTSPLVCGPYGSAPPRATARLHLYFGPLSIKSYLYGDIFLIIAF